MQFAGGGEGVAEGAVDPDALLLRQLAEAVGAGADALDEEVEAHPARGRSGFGYGEGAGQEGALGALLPVILCGQHVELAWLGLGALLVEQREEAVAPGGTVLGDLAEAAPEGGGHRGCFALSRPWISCRERTSGSRSILAAIARIAAEAPVIVVTQGIPSRTAAVRIS